MDTTRKVNKLNKHVLGLQKKSVPNTSAASKTASKKKKFRWGSGRNGDAYQNKDKQ